MKCNKCGSHMDESDVECIGVVTRGEGSLSTFIPVNGSLDIVMTCPKCGHVRNGFLDVDDMIDLEKK